VVGVLEACDYNCEVKSATGSEALEYLYQGLAVRELLRPTTEKPFKIDLLRSSQDRPSGTCCRHLDFRATIVDHSDCARDFLPDRHLPNFSAER
jgi:hypothetical protein